MTVINTDARIRWSSLPSDEGYGAQKMFAADGLSVRVYLSTVRRDDAVVADVPRGYIAVLDATQPDGQRIESGTVRIEVVGP